MSAGAGLHLPPVDRLARMLARVWFGAAGPVAGRGPLHLEQVLALDPRRRLLVVRCGPQRLLLLTGGAQDLALGWLPAEPPPESGS